MPSSACKVGKPGFGVVLSDDQGLELMGNAGHGFGGSISRGEVVDLAGAGLTLEKSFSSGLVGGVRPGPTTMSLGLSTLPDSWRRVPLRRLAS
jgi:hypothetical protein